MTTNSESASDFEEPNEHWEKVTFSNVIDINNYPSANKGQKYKSVGMADLGRFNRKIEGWENKEYTYSRPRFKNGDTLMARITPCLENGKTAYVDILDEDEVAVGSTEFIVMSATQKTTPKFVYYTARRPEIRQFAIKRMTGTSGRQRVPLDIFDNMEINLPPIEEQKKIVNVLDSIDTKIDVNNKINEILEEIAQKIFRNWFIDYDIYSEFKDSELGMIPSDFEVKTLSDIADIEMGSSPKSEYYNEDGEGLPFFQGNKNFAEIYPNIKRWCSEPQKVAQEGEIIMTVRAPVGEINRLQTKSCIGRGVAAFSSKNFDSNDYIYYLLKMRKNRWEKFASGTTYDSVNSTDVAEFPVACPPTSEIQRYINLVSTFTSLIRENTVENKRLNQLRDNLLPKLMSGEIRVNDINLEDLDVGNEV